RRKSIIGRRKLERALYFALGVFIAAHCEQRNCQTSASLCIIRLYRELFSVVPDGPLIVARTSRQVSEVQVRVLVLCIKLESLSELVGRILEAQVYQVSRSQTVVRSMVVGSQLHCSLQHADSFDRRFNLHIKESDLNEAIWLILKLRLECPHQVCGLDTVPKRIQGERQRENVLPENPVIHDRRSDAKGGLEGSDCLLRVRLSQGLLALQGVFAHQKLSRIQVIF